LLFWNLKKGFNLVDEDTWHVQQTNNQEIAPHPKQRAQQSRALQMKNFGGKLTIVSNYLNWRA